MLWSLMETWNKKGTSKFSCKDSHPEGVNKVQHLQPNKVSKNPIVPSNHRDLGGVVPGVKNSIHAVSYSTFPVSWL